MHKVAVLLSTFNGGRFLETQLNSLKRQKKVKLKLFIIDDGSVDNTIKIIKNADIPKKIYKTKNYKNPVKNFLFLIDKVPKNYDFYCFSDQDDYWLSNKLIYSISKLKKKNADILGSRTLYTDKKLRITGKSLLFKKKVSLRNSLVQSITGGNTQLWTKKFNNILKKIKKRNPASHDWYLYQVAMIFNLKYLYIKEPLIYYRQHENNVIGSNVGLINIIKRIYWGINGRYKKWHDMNSVHLNYICANFEISKKNKDLISNFYYYRNYNSVIKRVIKIIYNLKIYRQTLQGNIMLIMALILKKV